MSRLILKNGRVIDPSRAQDKQEDIYIENGKIAAPSSDFNPDQIIDCTSLIICPGLIDMGGRWSTHHQEGDITLASETAAALANGITTLICAPDNGALVIDTPDKVFSTQQKAHSLGTRLFLLGALTDNLAGEMLSPLAALQTAGCVGLTQAFHPIKNLSIWRHALEYAAQVGLPVVIYPVHPELHSGVAHEGEVAVRLGLKSIPVLSETLALSQALLLQQALGFTLHFSALSAAQSMTLLAQAKDRGVKVTADVPLSHLYLTEWDVEGFNAQAHTFPPLRSVSDQQGLLAGIENGLITALSSQHRPLGLQAKLAPFPSTLPGISGWDTFLPLILALQHKTSLSLLALLKLVTYAPASLFNLPYGTLKYGAPADICIFDAGISFTLTTTEMRSQGKNTPFLGWPLEGQVLYTLVDGKIVYQRNSH